MDYKNTFQEMMKAANWKMTVERKETKSGNVSYVHTVFFKGEKYQTRKSPKKYAAYWLEVQLGGMEKVLNFEVDYFERNAKDWREKAKNGVHSEYLKKDYWTPERCAERAAEWEEKEKEAAANLAKFHELYAENKDYDWRVMAGGFAGRRDLVKGNLHVYADQ